MLGLLVSMAGALVVAGEVDLNATVVAEARGGQAPLVANEDPRASVIGLLTPTVDLTVRNSNLDLRLEYGPRIIWRQPNLAKRLRPLVLHVTELLLATRLTPSTAWTAGASLSVGEVDYTVLPQLIGTVQASVPPVADVLVLTARTSLEQQASHVLRLGLVLEGAHRRTLDSVAPTVLVGSPFLQKQNSVQAAPYATLRLSRLDELTVAGAVAYRWFESGVSFFSVTPQLGWRRRLSPTAELRLSGGATYGYASYGDMMAGMQGTGTQVTISRPLDGAVWAPVGSAELTGLLVRHPGMALVGGAGVLLDYYVDPVLTLAQRRLALTARLNLLLRDRWMVGVEGMAGTSIDPLDPPKPDPVTMTMIAPVDATFVGVSVPIRRRLSDQAILEFGGRWADRAPHTTDGGLFQFHQRQLWAYVMLTVTTREVPRWGLTDLGDSERRPPRRQVRSADAVTSSVVTSRVGGRATDRVSGSTGAGPGTGTGTAASGTSAGTTGTRGSATNGGAGRPVRADGTQPPADGRPTLPEDEELEPERQGELPDQGQLPIGIGGIR